MPRRRLALFLAASLVAAGVAIGVACGDGTDPRHSAEQRVDPLRTVAAESGSDHLRIAIDFIDSGIDVATLERTEILAKANLHRLTLVEAFGAADIVVRGTITLQHVELDHEGRSHVISEIEVTDQLKGQRHDRVAVRERAIVSMDRGEFVLATFDIFPVPPSGTDVIYFLERLADGRYVPVPFSSTEIVSDGTTSPLTNNTNLSDIEGRPADEVLQLLRDLTAGGP
jgi:hypothetical protein